MITGVSFATSGDIYVNGKVAALLELTAGFSGDMTGRENIYLKCYLLGLEKSEISEIENSIIEFAALGEYIDQPVKNLFKRYENASGLCYKYKYTSGYTCYRRGSQRGDAEFRKNARPE